MPKKGKKQALPKKPPKGMDERNAVYVGRRVGVRGIRSPIMIVTGIRGNHVRTLWFNEALQQCEGVFLPDLLAIIPEKGEKTDGTLFEDADGIRQCRTPSCGREGEDPLETLKKTQEAAQAAKE